MTKWLFPHFSPVIKVVSAGCNIRCEYCFYAGWQPEIKIMSEETLREVIDKCLAVAPNVRFIWHGGEPMIPGIGYYENMIRICEELQRPNQSIRHSIQTNGTLISHKWIDFLIKHKFGVGVSIDGPAHMQNHARIDASGKGTFDRVMSGINLLRINNVKFGTVAVVNSYSVNYPDEMFDFFYGEHLSFNANPCTANPYDDEVVRSLAINPHEYTDFVLRLTERWLDTDDPTFRVGPVDDLIKGVMGHQPRLCRFKGQCFLYVTIDSNGDVYPCDGFLNKNYLLGNLWQSEMTEIQSTERYRYFSGRPEILEACKSCEWSHICRGGCMRTWEGEKNIKDPNGMDFCEARKLLFNGVRAKLASIGSVQS